MKHTLQDVIDGCKCGIYLTINEHKDVYDTPEKAIEEINDWDERANGKHDDYEPEIDDELAKRMIEANQIYKLQFYPHTPIGFYVVYGTSLQEVVDKAIEALRG